MLSSQVKNPEEQRTSIYTKALIIFALIMSGEAIFFLPFVIPRIFRPTYLDVFKLTNLELGSAFSVYGVVAMLSYFLGGPIADRFSARKLMTIALLATAASGTVLIFIPSFEIVVLLYAFWGMTTILLFWAALLRATREWGGNSSQGKAYGLLDGGRGLLAALLASITVAIFAALLPEEVSHADFEERAAAFSRIILIFVVLVTMVAALVWFVIPDSDQLYQSKSNRTFDWEMIKKVLKVPAIWLQAAIVLCAYVGYKSTDDFSLYARDAFGYDEVQSAYLGTISYWVRPFVAIAAGFMADRFSSSKVVVAGFVITLVGSLFIGLGMIRPGIFWMLATTVAGVSIGIYALRGIYFALFQESKIPFAITGTAVGIVSVVGYTPDIFMGPVMGYLLDTYPGAEGHQYVFMMLAAFALIGLVCSIWFRYLTK